MVISVYAVRLVLSAYYEFRISSLQDRLENLQKQRDQTVAKLKEATKYDTTLQLLEKYGGGATKSKPPPGAARKAPKESSGPKQQRKTTGFVPPPTANIPSRRAPSSAPGTPDRSAPFSPPPNPPHTAGPHTSNWQPPEASMGPNAEFAPNAFNAPPQYMMESSGPSWYDRLMDVLLGEDETHPKNRLVLICQNCRLVNGQAPPGIKTLQEVGKWRCSSCGTMNGNDPVMDALATPAAASPVSKENSTIDVSAEAIEEREDHVAGHEQEDDHESDVTQYSGDEAPQDQRTESGRKRTAAKSQSTETKPLPKRSRRGKTKTEDGD